MEKEINFLFRDNYIQMSNDSNSPVGKKSLRKSFSVSNKFGVDDKLYDILAKQINHLAICFDIYLESESNYLKNYEVQAVKLFPTSVR